jgi:SagB-type dehydrogenase family enzyme
MNNRDTQRAWDYHNRTKHFPESVRRNVHVLDWANHPLPFKIYPDLEPLPLPQETDQTGVAALSAIATDTAAPREATPNSKTLTHLLYFSAGITKRRRSPGGEILFRAAACTGALYEVELYLVCGTLPDLTAGVYHFNPGELALRRLREGDYRGAVVEAGARDASLLHAPVIVISTGVYWRNAWKYQARTFRHFGWDNGTLLANLLAATAALGLPARVLCGFIDAEINGLLGLDARREVSLSLLALGHSKSQPPPRPAAVAPLELQTVPVSREEVDYPAMREMHLASSLATAEEVAEWRDRTLPLPAPEYTGPRVPLEPLDDERIPRDTIEEVVLRRGSSRRFRRESISLAQFATILDRSTRGVAADFLTPFGARLNDLYLIVHAVEGLVPGAYFYHGATACLERLKPGQFRHHAAHLALDQDLAGDAAAAVFFLADLNVWLDRFGNRGYRAVQLEAGILGGKMYLAAYSQRLGATGLTFYDDEVVEFFSPHAAAKSAIFLVALGHPARQPS